MTAKQASEIMFGIEVECYLPQDAEIQIGHHYHGLQVEWAPEGWKAESDGSLCNPPAGYKAVEITSPKLAGETGLQQVVFVLDTINELHGKVNSTCGLHVHVDARWLDESQVQAIRRAFVQYEMAFYALSGNLAHLRYMNSYCNPSKQWTGDGNVDRYQSLNFTNHYRGGNGKNTLEIRCFAGSLNPETVVAAVYMAVSIVSRATREGAAEAEQISDPVKAMQRFFDAHLREDAGRIVPDEIITRQWFTRRAKAAAAVLPH